MATGLVVGGFHSSALGLGLANRGIVIGVSLLGALVGLICALEVLFRRGCWQQGFEKVQRQRLAEDQPAGEKTA